jgi:fermentation-respiration switch protein FrsA (DUF1100 family)
VKAALLSLLALAAAGYVLIAAVMFFMQRNLLYVPGSKTFEAPSAVGLDGFEPVTLSTKDDVQLKGWYSPPPHNPAPVFLYLHGNAGTLADRAERFSLFREEGFGVLAISWRGFGGSGGSPSEDGLLEDGRTALKHLQAQGIGLERVVIFGESLGSGVAVQLAAQADMRPAALVLDAPFTSTADVARLRYGFLPVGLLMKDQFRSDLHAQKVTAPVMVLHGTADEVTPFRFGKRLSEMFGGPVKFCGRWKARRTLPT